MPALKLDLRQLERILIRRHGLVEELLQRVLRAQLEIIDGDFGLRGQAHVFQVGGAGLRRRRRWRSTVLRTRPQKSGCQEASNGSE